MWTTADEKVTKYLNRALTLGLDIKELNINSMDLGDWSLYLVKKNNRDYNLYIPKEIQFVDSLDDELKEVRGTLRVIGGESLELLDGLFREIKLEELDLTKLNTDKCISMQSVFSYSTINKIIFPDNWNTSNVITMHNMFSNLNSEKILELDLNSWNMENVEDLTCMFMSSAFKSLKINKWELNYGTKLIDAFKHIKIDTLDLTGMELSKLKLNKEDYGKSTMNWQNTVKEIMVDEEDYKYDKVRTFLHNINSEAKIIIV